jgi:hypothetical protein
VQFRAVVYMDETITAHGEVTELDRARKRAKLTVWVELERAGLSTKPIKNSTAWVQLA